MTGYEPQDGLIYREPPQSEPTAPVSGLTLLKYNERVGMFVELMTMWKRTRETTSSASEGGDQPVTITKTLTGPIQWLLHCASKLRTRSRPTISRKATWRRRRVGVLYSKQPNYWVYLVLLEPVDEDLEFCHRIIEDGDDENVANCRCTGGPRFYNGAQASLKNLVGYFMDKIATRGTSALDQLLQDVFWGWEEYLTHVKSRTMSVS